MLRAVACSFAAHRRVNICFHNIIDVDPRYQTMPRIGATLFSLLILTQYRNAAIAQLPESDSFVWIDVYLFTCALLVSQLATWSELVHL